MLGGLATMGGMLGIRESRRVLGGYVFDAPTCSPDAASPTRSATVSGWSTSTHQGMAALRIQTHCHLLGQAAGFAAAMSLDQAVPPAQIDVAKLQKRLRDSGVFIDPKRVAQAG